MNLLVILVCAVISMILGALWYGPIFGKAWMRLNKIDSDCMTDPVKRKEANRKAMPLYGIQFVLSIFQFWVLAQFISGWGTLLTILSSIWIWLAFIMPTIAGTVMWGNNDSRKEAWQKFFIQAGFQLVIFIAAAVIISIWR